MKTVTEQDYILAARAHIRKLGRARRILLVLERQLHDLQKELAYMDGQKGYRPDGGGGGRSSASPVESVAARREHQRQEIALQIEELEQERAKWKQSLMIYERSRAVMDKRYADAVHEIDFLGKTAVQASAALFVAERTARQWERRGLKEYAFMILGMADKATLHKMGLS